VIEVRAAALADLPAGAPLHVDAGSTPVCLVRVGDDVHAIADVCTHQGGRLSGGKLSGHRLACPRHGWMFDVRTGQCVFPPRGTAVARYPTRVDEAGVWVEISSGS
jgi:nitrite reductase/ring-hydroxylating ferredoxin subunit